VGLYNEARVPGCKIGGPALFPSRFVFPRWMPSDGQNVGCGSS
jgi:hypothetical protein